MERGVVATEPGVELEVETVGRRGDPAVVLLHGFPESAHSWRHQMQPLAEAGYFVIAPNQRGYAGSTAPDSIEAYRADHLTADVVALLDHFEIDRAVIVGHDWGALVAWHLAMLHPERCRAVLAASVPYNVWPAAPTEVFAAIHGDRFFYILYFQQPGVAEAELDADIERFLQSVLWVAAGESRGIPLSSEQPAQGTTLIGSFEHRLGYRPTEPPPWLPAADLAVYVEQFSRSGFFGPVSWYRNFDANWELTKQIGPERLTMPTAFVAGSNDPVVARRALIETQDALLPAHLGSHLIDGAGHWVQQEAPQAFNRWLLSTLEQLS